MKPLIIIPARGGSKGIPGKNIKPLGGTPLIGYTIEVAKTVANELGLAAENIIVSTDDEGIAEVVTDMGVAVPYRRPAELATDTAGSRGVMLDAMQWADTKGIEYDCIVLLQPTSPFRIAGDVLNCLCLYEGNHPDMVVSVKESATNPYYNCYESDPYTGCLKISKGDGLYTRRQDAPKTWEFNGAVYVINPNSLRMMPMGSFPIRIPYEMPAERSIDLDTNIDWVVAEAIINSRH